MVVFIDGQEVLIDEEDLRIIKQRTWHIQKSWDKTYIRSHTTETNRERNNIHKCKAFQLHREIMQAPFDMEVDHINGNVFDNRKVNLRVCTHQQNNWNKPIRKDNRSGYKGVTYDKRRGHYRASIKKDGTGFHLGYYKTAIEAHEAYKSKAAELFGEYANFG